MFQRNTQILRSMLIAALGRQPSKGTGTLSAKSVPSAPGQFKLRDTKSGDVSDLLVLKICAPVIPPELVQFLQQHRVAVHLMRRSAPSSGEELKRWVQGQRQSPVMAPLMAGTAQHRAELLSRGRYEPDDARGPADYHLPRDVQHFLMVHRKTVLLTFPGIAESVHGLLTSLSLMPEPASDTEVNEILDAASDQEGFWGSCYEVDMGSGRAFDTLQSIWEQGEPEQQGICWNWVSLVAVSSGHHGGAVKDGVRHRATPPAKELLVKIEQSRGAPLLWVRAGGCASTASIGDTTARQWEYRGLRTERTKGSTFFSPEHGPLGFWIPRESLFSWLYSEERPLGGLQPTAIPLAALNRTIVGFDPFKSTEGFNTTLIGGSGSGKSYIAKDVIRACIARGARVRVVGYAREYDNFCETLQGTVVKLGQAGAGLNLLALVPPEGFEETGYLMRQLTAWISDLVERVEPIRVFDQEVIERALSQTWNRIGTAWTLQEVMRDLALEDPVRGPELAKAMGQLLSDSGVAALFTATPAPANTSLVVYELPPNLSGEVQAVAAHTALLVEQIRTKQLQLSRTPTLLVVDNDGAMSLSLHTAQRALQEARALYTGLFICVPTGMAVSESFVELVGPRTRHLIFLDSGRPFYSGKLPRVYGLTDVQARQLSELPHPRHPATALIVDRFSQQSSVVQWSLTYHELRLFG